MSLSFDFFTQQKNLAFGPLNLALRFEVSYGLSFNYTLALVKKLFGVGSEKLKDFVLSSTSSLAIHGIGVKLTAYIHSVLIRLLIDSFGRAKHWNFLWSRTSERFFISLFSVRFLD